MPVLKTNTDALIVGAGPTGLALAAELRRQGADPLIIDRQTAGANTSRACVVHARTLEVLEPLGALHDFWPRGEGADLPRPRAGSLLITVDFSEIRALIRSR